jgi:Glycosyl hydrolases family 43
MWLLLGVLLASVPPVTTQDAATKPPFALFSYFVGNGEDGLHFASTTDGLTWTPLAGGRTFLRPQVGSKLMRDPCILRGPDGMFHMVWTTGWWDAGIGLAHSKDLVDWSAQEFVPVMAQFPGARNAWAPELAYDQQRGQYLIFWASTVPGRFPETEQGGDIADGRPLNHRIYFTTTRDFRNYSPTRLFYDGGFNVIDATIIRHGGEYVMILKDETKQPPKKHLRLARASRITGPYPRASEPISIDWVEGPTALQVDGEWIVYYDEYTRKRFGAIASRDLKIWRVVSDRISFPADARHGTAFEVAPEIIARLESASR